MTARGWRGPAGSLLVYGIITAVLGRDLLAMLGTTIAHDPGDPLLTAAILHWNAHHVPLTEAWWGFPIFHPTRDALAFSEHLLGVSVIATPLAWIAGNPLAAYNLTLLLTFPLAAMAMYALVYRLTSSVPAAFLAGLAFGFAPYRMSTLPHIQMLMSFWAPLALLGLHGYIGAAEPPSPSQAHPPVSPGGAPMRSVSQDSSWAPFRGGSRGRSRTRLWWLVLFAAGWALQGAANGYALVFFSVLVGLWVAWFVIARGNWRALAMIAAAAGVAGVLLAPILYKYVAVHARHGFERSLEEMRTYSADVAAVLCAPETLTFWGWIRVACRAEGELFPGVAMGALFAAALAWTLHRRRPGRTVVLVGVVLLGVALVFALIVASILVAGPWQFDRAFIHVSASEISKPFLVSLAAVTAALLLVLVPLARRGPTSTIGFYLFAAVVTWLLALGPTLTLMGEPSGRPGPFMLLQVLPGVGALRVPARFWLMTVMCLSVVAGLFIAEMLRGGGRRLVAPTLLIAGGALLADGWIARIPAAGVPPMPPAAAALEGGVVLQLPMGLLPDIAATWRAVTGGWRSVNGYSGYAPNYYEPLRLGAEAADEGVFPPLRSNHALHVLLAQDDANGRAMVERQAGATLTAEGAGLAQYRLPRIPASAEAPVGTRQRIARARSDCARGAVGSVADGNERTTWECWEASQSHHLTLELAERGDVGAIVYSVGAHSWTVPTQLAVETSTDGAVWDQARSGSVVAEFIEGGLGNPGALRAVLRFPSREARYVRVRPIAQPADFAWLVAEIDVRSR